jgi:hypothetical protein
MPFQIGYIKFSLLYDSTYSFDESGRRNQNMFFFHLWKMQKLFIAKSDLFFRFLKKFLIPSFRFKIDYILGFPCFVLRDNT